MRNRFRGMQADGDMVQISLILAVYGIFSSELILSVFFNIQNRYRCKFRCDIRLFSRFLVPAKGPILI